MAGDVTLREATAADAARIAQVWEAAWRDGHVGNIPDELLVQAQIEGGTATVECHRYEL